MDINSEKPRTKHDPETHPTSFFAWISSAAVIILIFVRPLIDKGEMKILTYTGIVLLFTSSVLIFAPFFQLKKHGHVAHNSSYLHTRRVVKRGVYAIVRHPQYVGYSFLAVGFALLSQHWITSVLALVCLTGYYLAAVQEEKLCRLRFGKSYETYCQHVPRFNIVLGIFRFIRKNLFSTSQK